MFGFGMPGPTEWFVILAIVLIIFGPGKLPDVFRKAGEGIRAFKDASEGKEKAEDEKERAKASTRTARNDPKQIATDELDDEPANDRTGASTRGGTG